MVRLQRWTVVLGVLVAACGGSAGGNNPLQPPPGPAVLADTVNIVDNSFGPSAVKILNGGTVTWTWNASNTAEHNIRWGVVPVGTSPPPGPTQAVGSPFEVTFTAVGSYQFVCTLHTGMEGTVFVE